MENKKWLISWIGKADHLASGLEVNREAARESDADTGEGPIATALLSSLQYDRVCLLTNYGHAKGFQFCEWIEKKCSYPASKIDLQEIDLINPIHYASIYQEVSKHLKDLGLPRDDIDLTFHLSPGTPAMATIWIMLAKTRFPAKLIQTSKENGLQSVDVSFDLANDFLPEYLQRSGERIERLVQGPVDIAPHFQKIIHQSEKVKTQIALARRYAAFDVPVLILGQTGTGKELFAEAICAASARADKPLITVNCGAIAPEMANSELFGHLKGAFTGAINARKGHFQEAHGGTLFLDEVGDLPLDTQVRLLRAIQAKEVMPMGSSRAVSVDVRIIAATHRDLADDVGTGRFREDLFQRLAVGILKLPPLRERDGDVSLLIDVFIERINADARGKPEAQDKRISLEARKILLDYGWPGNIRELYHSLLRAYIWCSGAEIQPQDVQSALLQIQEKSQSVMGRPLTQGFNLQALLDQISSDYILRALKQTGDRKTTAAHLLGFTNHQTLSNWMKRLDLDEEESKN